MTRSIDTCALFKPLFLYQRETPVERDKTEMLKNWEKACPTDQLKKEALASDDFVRKFIDKSAHTFQNSTYSNEWEWDVSTQRVFFLIKGKEKFYFLRVDKPLGMGSYGRVYQVKNIFEGIDFALKISRQIGETEIRKELDVYKKLYPRMSMGTQHTGIQKNCMQILLKAPNFAFSDLSNSFRFTKDAMETPERYGILMPLYLYGNLYDRFKVPFPLHLYHNQQGVCVYQILLAQARLQDKNMVHLDLSPTNCLIVPNGSDTEINISDMGGVVILDQTIDFAPLRKDWMYQKDYDDLVESNKKKDHKNISFILLKNGTLHAGLLIYMLSSHAYSFPYKLKQVGNDHFADSATLRKDMTKRYPWLVKMWDPNYKKRPTPKKALLDFHYNYVGPECSMYKKYDAEIQALCQTKDKDDSKESL